MQTNHRAFAYIFEEFFCFRGSELINMHLVESIEERKSHEEMVLNKIKRRLERIKQRQYRLGMSTACDSKDHYTGGSRVPARRLPECLIS